MSVDGMALALAAMLAGAGSVSLGAVVGQYERVAEIKIGGAGAFDYLTVDPASHRLYVTYGTEVVVIDTDSSAIVGRSAGSPRVHGMAIGPASLILSVPDSFRVLGFEPR